MTAIAATVLVGTGTVTVAVPLTPLKEAVMVVEPAATPFAIPLALMVATAGLELVHVTADVTVAVELSLYVAVAANCVVAPTAIVAVAGAMVSAETVLPAAVFAMLVEPPPHPILTAINERDAKTEM